ncbi:MAG: preprotein translocase subunit SecG [Eubacteriales bacterium]|nr:preprotein translocase subunit SecG [Eubacteriales bacterium]
MEVARTILTIILLIVSVLLIVVVLMQSSKSSGLGSAFGGDTQSISNKGKAASKEAKLQKLTKILAIAMGVLALAMAIIG